MPIQEISRKAVHQINCLMTIRLTSCICRTQLHTDTCDKVCYSS